MNFSFKTLFVAIMVTTPFVIAFNKSEYLPLIATSMPIVAYLLIARFSFHDLNSGKNREIDELR